MTAIVFLGAHIDNDPESATTVSLVISLPRQMPRFPRPTFEPHPDDIMLWPDGTWATREDVERGYYNGMSDDREIISIDDIDRLSELGILDDIG